MYSDFVGPFTKYQTPARPGVYFLSPYKNARGGGYCYWDGKKWNKYGNWGGDYFNGWGMWYWFGLIENARKYPIWLVKG